MPPPVEERYAKDESVAGGPKKMTIPCLKAPVERTGFSSGARPRRRWNAGRFGLGLLLVSASCDATDPSADLSRLSIDVSHISVAIHGTVTFPVSAYDASGREVPRSKLAWNSSDTSVATVSGTGVVLGRAFGVATISASYGARRDATHVTVTPGGIRLSAASSTTVIAPGATLELAVSFFDALGRELVDAIPSVTWHSTRPEIATVTSERSADSGTALVTGMQMGLTDIGVSAAGATASLAVLVLPPEGPLVADLTVEEFHVREIRRTGTADEYLYVPVLRVTVNEAGETLELERIDFSIPGFAFHPASLCAKQPVVAGQQYVLFNGDPYEHFLSSNWRRTTGHRATALLTFRNAAGEPRGFAVEGPIVTGSVAGFYYDADNFWYPC